MRRSKRLENSSRPVAENDCEKQMIADLINYMTFEPKNEKEREENEERYVAQYPWDIVKFARALEKRLFKCKVVGNIKMSPYLRRVWGKTDIVSGDIELSKYLLNDQPRSVTIRALLRELSHASARLDWVKPEHKIGFVKEMERIEKILKFKIDDIRDVNVEKLKEKSFAYKCEKCSMVVIRSVRHLPMNTSFFSWSKNHTATCGGSFTLVDNEKINK